MPKAIFIVEVEVLLTRYGGAANLAGFEEVYVHTYLHTNIHTNIWSVVQIYVFCGISKKLVLTCLVLFNFSLYFPVLLLKLCLSICIRTYNFRI